MEEKSLAKKLKKYVLEKKRMKALLKTCMKVLRLSF